MAYVHAPWSQIPWEAQMKLTVEKMMKHDDNERLARKQEGYFCHSFSAENFNGLFGEKSLAANWTSDDALGVWYSLGRFCSWFPSAQLKDFRSMK